MSNDPALEVTCPECGNGCHPDEQFCCHCKANTWTDKKIQQAIDEKKWSDEQYKQYLQEQKENKIGEKL